MKTIWKFALGLASGDTIQIDMPVGARVLSAGSQEYGSFVVWAIVDPNAELIQHRFAVHSRRV